MNIQHSSKRDDWMTPVDILERVRYVLGSIELDPASTAKANERVQASKIFTASDDGLSQDWGFSGSIFVNPPGGTTRNRSNSQLFWEKLMDSNFGHAIFLAFSIEAMQTTQRSVCSILDFPFCVPKRRMKFDLPTGIDSRAPSHSNVIVYIPRVRNCTNRFVEAFSPVGKVRV